MCYVYSIKVLSFTKSANNYAAYCTLNMGEGGKERILPALRGG